jgi:hypothetical protein
MIARSFFLPCILLVVFRAPVIGQVGQTGLAFLKLGVGARALGMGEAYSAIATDPSGMYYNPASLALASTPQLLLMHKEWIQDTKTEYIGATTNVGKVVLGISVNSTSISNIEIREVPGPAQGSFDSRNAAIGISGAYRLDSSFSIGITGKYLYEKILVNEASGLAVDLGGWYLTPWNVRLALAVNDLGSLNELEYESTKLPTTIRAGAAYEIPVPSIDGTVTAASDIVTITGENKTHLHLGAEGNYRQSLLVRLGYQTGYDARSFSTGVGFRYGLFQFDYAFVPTKFDLGSTHTFSLMIDFR